MTTLKTALSLTAAFTVFVPAYGADVQSTLNAQTKPNKAKAQPVNAYDFEKINNVSENMLSKVAKDIDSLKLNYPGLNDATFAVSKYPNGQGDLSLSDDEKSNLISIYSKARIWRELIYSKNAKYVKLREGPNDNAKPSTPSKQDKTLSSGLPQLSQPPTQKHLIVGTGGIYMSFLIVSGPVSMISYNDVIPVYVNPLNPNDERNIHLFIRTVPGAGQEDVLSLRKTVKEIVDKNLPSLLSALNHT